jgi:hypothetical protein
VLLAVTLGKTKVGEFQVAVRINENVVWLDVSMDVSQGVDCLDRHDELRRIEGCGVLAEAAVVPPQPSQIAARYVVHQKIKRCVVLEGSVESDNPFAVAFSQCVSLGVRLCVLNGQYHMCLEKPLERIGPSILFLADQMHLSESTFPDRPDDAVAVVFSLGPEQAEVPGF